MPGIIVNEKVMNENLSVPWGLNHDHSIRRKAHMTHNYYITFHGVTTSEQNEELEEWLKINTTKNYVLCRDRVYFKAEADMGWFLLRWPPS